jgi:hypothetical protein
MPSIIFVFSSRLFPGPVWVLVQVLGISAKACDRNLAESGPNIMINIIVRVLWGFYNEESTAFHCGEPRVTCQPMQVARDSILTGFVVLRWGLRFGGTSSPTLDREHQAQHIR